MFKVAEKDFGDRIDFPKGVYTAKLKKVEELESKDAAGNPEYDEKTGAQKFYRLWVFEVLKGKYKGEEIVKSSSMAFGPNSNARKWVEGIIGRTLQNGETVEPEELYDVPVHVQWGDITNPMTGAITKGITGVYRPPEDDDEDEVPASKSSKQKVAAGNAPAEDDDDLSDLPF